MRRAYEYGKEAPPHVLAAVPSWWVLIRAARTLGMSYPALADDPNVAHLVAVASSYEQLRAEFAERDSRR